MTVVVSATLGNAPAWDGSDTDMVPVAGARVVTAWQEAAAGGEVWRQRVIFIM